MAAGGRRRPLVTAGGRRGRRGFATYDLAGHAKIGANAGGSGRSAARETKESALKMEREESA